MSDTIPPIPLQPTDLAPQEWTMVITPQEHWFDLHIRELWHYRDLVMLFVRRDFVSVYKQTILGPLWFFIQPLMTTVIYNVIFGSVAKLPTDGLPPFIFYLSGVVIWTYFADCLNKTSNTFIQNANIFGKVYFPRVSVPISILISNLITFGIQFLLFLGFLVYFLLSGANVHLTGWIFITPVLLILMAGIGFGLGIIISALTTRYRDLRYLVTFGVQLLMYVTPVIYPASSIPQKLQWVIYANPLTAVVETFRYAFLGAGTINLPGLAYSAAFMVVVVLLGLGLFNHVEKNFMDTI